MSPAADDRSAHRTEPAHGPAHGPDHVPTHGPTHGPTDGPNSYRADVDGLRAVAVLAVLVYHAFPGRLPGGFVGVDVFFVLSGYLITGILLNGLADGRFRLRQFYARRVRRIFPALAVMMAACWIFGWFALFPDEYRQLGRHLAGGAAFVSNFYFWGEAGYFDNAAETKPLLHLWSLGIEEQFYIVWPLLLLLAHRWRVGFWRWMPWLALASFAVNVAFVRSHPTATFYSPASRAWELALGGLLAGLAFERDRRNRGTVSAEPAGGLAAGSGTRLERLPPDLLSATGLALLGFGLAFADERSGFPGWWALLPTLGTALLVQAGANARINRLLLANRPMVWIGLISYPLYLWHWPLLSFARIVESETPARWIRIAALVASFVLAVATYFLVERPLRFGGNARRKVAALAGAMVVIFAVGRVTAAQRGLPQRATVQEQLEHQQALVLPDESAPRDACKRRFGLDSYYQFCLIDRVDDAPTVALVGDSHAHHLVAGLSEHYRRHGDNLLYLGTRLPYWGVDFGKDDHFQQITDGMLDLALATPTIHTVIIATKLKFEAKSRRGKYLTAAMNDTIERFLAAGKHVILVRDVPELDFEPRQCIRRAAIPTSKTKLPCAIPRAEFESKTAKSDAVLFSTRERFPEIEIFDAPSYLCDETLCWAMREDKLLYRDKDHLSTDGDLFLGRKFAEERAN